MTAGMGGGDGPADSGTVTDTVVSEAERIRRWRMILGGGSAAEPDGTGVRLGADDVRIDAALSALYEVGGSGRKGLGRQGGLGASAPGVARWLGDIRTFFPSTVVHVMQRDAIERLHLQQLLLEPEMLATVQPDVHLVATLLELSAMLPDATRATARAVVRVVADDIHARLADKVRQAVSGALHRSARSRRPKLNDVDWNRTIGANLRHYLPEHKTVIPERLIGYGRRQHAIGREIILAIDQSGSMADSVVYAGVLGSVLASLRTLRTSVIAFDTAVVDLTDQLDDPVDVLFGVQLGGGTDINAAVAYCESLITQPSDTVLILLSDLFEGGVRDALVLRMAHLVRAGVVCIALLALSDEGAPSFDRDHAAALAAVGVPSFACTPDKFADLIAAALQKGDIGQWATAAGITTTAAPGAVPASVPAR
jgi:VWA domain containing CoxE-like protein